MVFNKVVRSKRRRLLREATTFQRKYQMLNDSIEVLSMNPSRLRRVLKLYEKDLKILTTIFFEDTNFNRIIRTSQKKFLEDLKKFLSLNKIKVTNSEDLVSSIREEYNESVNRVTKSMAASMNSKTRLFKTLMQASEIPAREFDKAQRGADIVAGRTVTGISTQEANDLAQAGRRGFLKINGKTYDRKQINDQWEDMTARYGRSDKVKYVRKTELPDGTIVERPFDYPLRSYLDMKSATVDREISNRTTDIEASANGVMTVRFSSHGATDSCQFHENEIAFISQTAKEIYMKEFPSDKRAATMRTVQEIRDNPTHMLGPNCTHEYDIWPIQFFEPEEREQEVAENPIQTVPKKINEKKIVESTQERLNNAA